MGHDLAHVVEDGARVFGKVDDGADGQGVVDRAHALGNVTQGQKGQSAVPSLKVQVLRCTGDLKHQIAIGHHRPFGLAGRARGVNQKRGVFGPACVNGRIKARLGLRLLGQRHTAPGECVPGADLRIRQAAQALQLDHHDVLQLRTLAAHRQGFVQLLLVLHDEHPGATVLQNEGHLLGRGSGVKAHPDQSHGLGAHVGIQPFRAVFRQDGHGLTGLQALVAQGQSDSTGLLEIARPTDGVPDAFFLVPQRGLTGPLAAAQAPEFLRCVAALHRRWGRGRKFIAVILDARHRQVFRRFQRCLLCSPSLRTGAAPR